MSDLAYRLFLMNRALARPASELHPSWRPRYETCRLQVAQQIIGAGC